ncbi:chemotaxis protein CheW [Thermosynechococcaceae cyanobacterium BACA0444]|uniref:Chemotaxis protein CheW n=1 Tax=Pseudocalidococcus azoricus BACA0444 TaxID=2918990 RepID=A0AAE4FVT6_9CYAN|nr:chemotaxis protein CheW [Pseudocalidococcus azoricus]MDS3861981.1 chemotaxis protein CheW [Pseudocalidococcus azoricus BACA0444]
MALTASLKSRRKSRTTAEQAPTQRLLQFEIAQQQFALPITQVLKIIPLTTIHGDPAGRGIGLVHYQQQEVLVIDVENVLLPHNLPIKKTIYQFLLILQATDMTHLELLGIPIQAPPQLIRINPEAITPLPTHYRSLGNIHCVSTLMMDTQAPNTQPLFMIDVNQIFSGLNQP